jgi:nucleotide-binding universal stress UspA family protein
MTEPIVVAVALRDDDSAPLALGRDLARFTGAPLALMHVIRYDPHTPLPAEMFEDPQREHALSVLAGLAAPLVGEAEVTLHVEFSPSIVRGLHDAAEALRASQVVVGSSHRGRLGRTMPGGVGERLLHAAPSAVTIAPRGYRGTECGFRHIGVAFTDTPEGREALSAATLLAMLGGAGLSSYTVLEPFPELAPDGMATPPWTPPPGFDDRRRERARATAAQALADAPAELVEGIVILEGDPAAALAQASSGVDLLVCGSRGYGPVRSVVLGAVSTKLAHSCACPLLVLPRQETSVHAATASGSDRA